MTTPKFPIFMDYHSTTPLDPRVRAAMLELLVDDHAQGNPSSVHRGGRRARSVVEQARRAVARAASTIGARA